MPIPSPDSASFHVRCGSSSAVLLFLLVSACRPSPGAVPATPKAPSTPIDAQAGRDARPTVVAGYHSAVPRAPEEPDQSGLFMPRDLFQLEWASDPRISPDGRSVVYVRHHMDIMKDVRRTSLWLTDTDGRPESHRPIHLHPTGNGNAQAPRWSPDGDRLAYITQVDGKSQLFVRWMDTGQTIKVTDLQESPGQPTWSPDGRSIAFTMLVPKKRPPMARMPEPPKGATWAPKPKVIG